MFLGRELVKHLVLDEDAWRWPPTDADRLSVHGPLDPPAGGVALRRPAPGRRGRQAVLREAQLVIMDEPTAALGVTQTRVVLDLIRTLQSQASR